MVQETINFIQPVNYLEKFPVIQFFSFPEETSNFLEDFEEDNVLHTNLLKSIESIDC